MNFLNLAIQHYQKEGFGEAAYHGQTTLHPLGLVAILVLCGWLLVCKRSKAVYPFVVATCFLPGAQRLVIAGADFSMLRILILAGMLRVFMKGELGGFKWRKLDTLVTSWCLVSAVSFIMLWADASKLIFRVGQLYDILGMYIFFRVVVRTWGDVEGVVRFTVTLMPILLFLFMVEKNTAKNPFHFLGAQEWATIREGQVRCQGAFPHAILAGTYFAGLMPLVMARYYRKKGKLDAAIGCALIIGLAYFCRSSTPLVGVAASGVGMLAWQYRRSMGTFRMGTVVALFCLHMVMKAPVWHLIARISFSQGSTSHHRFLLIDNSIRYFFDWFLIGVKDTAYWGHAQGDLTNQFVREGARGGFLALILFVWVLVEGFSLAGRLWRTAEKNKAKRHLAWALGVSLFANALMFISISITHSQQNMAMVFFVLAALGTLGPADKGTRKRRVKRVGKGSDKHDESSGKPQARAA